MREGRVRLVKALRVVGAGTAIFLLMIGSYVAGTKHQPPPLVSTSCTPYDAMKLVEFDRPMERVGARPLDPPPSKIIVGLLTYSVKFKTKEDLPGLYGQTDLETQEIWLVEKLEPGQLRETLWHELLHVAIHAGTAREGLKGELSEDQIIERVSPAQVMILRDNPRLRTWLGRVK